MIGLPRGVEVFMYPQPCDMRRSLNTLSLLVEQSMRPELLSRDLFLFVSKNRKRSKVLYFDGTGLCLFAKRMESGYHFPAPWKMARAQLTLSELSLFIEGAAEVHGGGELSRWVVRLRPVDALMGYEQADKAFLTREHGEVILTGCSTTEDS